MYIFGDWSSHQVWGLRIDREANGGLGGVVPGSLVNLSTAFNRLTASMSNTELEGVTSFGEDAAGNLYFVELGGELYKIVGPIIGTAAGDYNHNGIVDTADYVVWRQAVGDEVPYYTGADGNGNGIVDDADYALWRANFALFPTAGAASGTGSSAPEPQSVALFLMGCSLFGQPANRRRRHGIRLAS
jgi:hypothetical protein